MRAANAFVGDLGSKGLVLNVRRVQVELFGSLAWTGRGHGTDRAIILGLCGEHPESIELASIEPRLAAVREAGALPLRGVYLVGFQEATDLLFHKDQTLPKHSNGMRFSAFDQAGITIHEALYYSIGSGFIIREGDESTPIADRTIPYPFGSAAQLLNLAEERGLSIWQIVFENEKASHNEGEIRDYVDRIWSTMCQCVARGFRAEGVLPGGLRVRRRAPALPRKLETEGEKDPLHAMDWVNVFAMAVNEENAAGGRMVTAPTNGAAGVVAAVAHYYWIFVEGASRDGLFWFFLTAAAIGILYKENASISGAEVGCQGEVGVACSMAAAGLVAALSGTNQQIEHAAEISMEHNLGMTCDPIGGLVQIPCIERNAMGAVKPINACRMAMRESGEHSASLDQAIKAMYESGKDMQTRHKETSSDGLATLNIIEC
jgi:L-serine dehydratase